MHCTLSDLTGQRGDADNRLSPGTLGAQKCKKPIGPARVIDAVAPSLPVWGAVDDFVLSMPDFGSKNIMVNQMGSLTGVIDWDLA